MRIQLRPSLLKIRRQSVKWIIIHSTAEIYPQPAARIDNSIYQSHELFKGVLEDKSADINYHYVVEKIKDEYIPIVTRPLAYLCEWPDIDLNINNRAVHIALLGEYNFKIPEPRCYDILAYRLVNPLLKLFKLSASRIKLHSELSNDKENSCPGEYFEKDILISKVRRFVVK